METQAKQIEIIYDYIVEVTTKQGRLIDKEILYGDGSRFNKNKELFNIVYNKIESIIKSI